MEKNNIQLIGPLSSPAHVKDKLWGFQQNGWDRRWSIKKNKVIHAYIVHSQDGMDEISPLAKTNVVEFKDGKINEFLIDPKDLGIVSKNKET